VRDGARGLVWYTVLAFGLSWAAWGAAYALGAGLADPLFSKANWLAAFAPAVAAIVVRRWITGEGFADVGWGVHLRREWPYCLVALLYPLVGILVVAGLASILGIATPDFSLEAGVRQLGQAVEDLPVSRSILPYVITLQGQPLKAALATGLVWGVWHYPVNLQGYNFPNHPYAGLVVFPIATVFLSIILGWLYRRTGSIWAPSLGHASLNSIGGSLSVLLFAGTEADMLRLETLVDPCGQEGIVGPPEQRSCPVGCDRDCEIAGQRKAKHRGDQHHVDTHEIPADYDRVVRATKPPYYLRTKNAQEHRAGVYHPKPYHRFEVANQGKCETGQQVELPQSIKALAGKTIEDAYPQEQREDGARPDNAYALAHRVSHRLPRCSVLTGSRGEAGLGRQVPLLSIMVQVPMSLNPSRL